MGTHSLDELLRLYTLEKITVELTLGQVLQHLQRINANLQRIDAAVDNMARLEHDAQRNASKRLLEWKPRRRGRTVRPSHLSFRVPQARGIPVTLLGDCRLWGSPRLRSGQVSPLRDSK